MGKGMGGHPAFIKSIVELKSLIRSVCGSNPSVSSVKELLLLCRKIAVIHLRKKITTGRLNPSFFALSIDDIALDCIADLFQKDESGAMFQLVAYYGGLSLESTSEEELLVHTRRLVFSKVGQGLFRLYNEADPSLGKILRNLKLAIQSLQNFKVVDRFGEQYMVPAMCRTLEHLPPIDREGIMRHLGSQRSQSENIPSILANLSRALREQTSSSRLVSMMDLALAIRSMYAATDEATEPYGFIDESDRDNARNIIGQSVRMLKGEMLEQYVGRKGIDRTMYDNYFLVIQQNLEERIIGNDGELFSFYDRLFGFAGSLTKDEYQRMHKSKLEYLGRLAHERALRELKRQFR